MPSAVFTIIAKNYLAQARVLMESVERTDPTLQRFVVLIDKPDGRFKPALEPFTVIDSAALSLPQSRWFHFKYTILELSTAVKPYAAEHLLSHYNIDRLIYFDPDIVVYSSLVENVLSRLDHANILLTPHLTAEVNDGRHPDELAILRAGAYNLGFLALRNSEVVASMLKWWQERLLDDCVVSPENGLFVDQKWVDLVPGMFPGVDIVQDPGWNVAYWNLHSRDVVIDDDSVLVNSSPLVFFHFSGFDPRSPTVVSRHQDRFDMETLGPAAELYRAYVTSLARHGFEECCDWSYSWSRFDDGSPIPEVARPVHREDASMMEAVSDPFSGPGRKAFESAWNAPGDDLRCVAAGLTRLAMRIYSVRSDVQAAMPDPFDTDSVKFRRWLLTSGVREHQLTDELLNPIRDSLVDNVSAAKSKASEEGLREYLYGGTRLQRLVALAPLIPGLPRKVAARFEGCRPTQSEVLTEVLRLLNEDYDSRPDEAPITNLMAVILQDRDDVRRSLSPDGTLAYGRVYPWVLAYGKLEYELPDSCISAVRAKWGAYVRSASLPEAAASLFWRLYFSLSVLRARAREFSAGRPRHSSRDLAEDPSVAVTARVNGTAGARHEEREFGVNLIGYARSEMGVGEAARRSHAALSAALVPVSITALSTSGNYPDRDEQVKPRESRKYAYTLMHVNADQLPNVVTEVFNGNHRAQSTIGYWAWELESFPAEYDEAFSFCREIWTLSEFCRRSIAARSPVPVHCFHPPIKVPECRPDMREDLGISANRFVYLVMFDMLSVFERKNPLGAIDAFRKAYPLIPNSELVVKINSAGHRPEQLDGLREHAGGLPIRFIDRTLERAEVEALIQSCDCLVSLHRAEGFGLALAEAMSIAKPVIATSYSGNMDFMDADNSFLVDYELSPVPRGCDPYPQTATWASPSAEHAAKRMVDVQTNPELTAAVARRGQRDVMSRLSPEAVGARMRARLEILRRLDRNGRLGVGDGQQ